MSYFYISQVKALSDVKNDAIIDFTPGCNVISGKSNSGKTMIIRTIDWLFGADYDKGKGLPFLPEVTGYHTAELTLTTQNGKIIMRRQVGKGAKLTVESTDSILKPGIYNSNEINKIWLSLMGLQDNIKIIGSEDMKLQSLTWRSLLPMIITEKEEIASDNSVIAKKGFSNTAILSAIIYLITNETNIPDDFDEPENEKKIRVKAVKNFVGEKLDVYKAKLDDLNKLLETYPNSDIIEITNTLVEKLAFIQNQIETISTEINVLTSKILNKHQLLLELNTSLEQLQALKTKYTSEIKRLENIVAGQSLLLDVPKKRKCPICESYTEKRYSDGYIESAKIELENTVMKLNDLVNVIKDLNNNISTCENDIKYYCDQKEILSNTISSQLSPKANIINSEIKEINSYILIKQEISILEKLNEEWNNDVIKYIKKAERKYTYKPKEHFEDDFVSDITNLVNSILNDINFRTYEPNYNVTFDLQEFDIKINKQFKLHFAGTGYKSYLNSILILAFREYFFNNATNKPNFFVIDSPFMGFDEGETEKIDENLKINFIKYISNHTKQSQLIILENPKGMPNKAYDSPNINYIIFSENGRKGFLDI